MSVNYNKWAKNIQWEKNILLNKWCWKNWIATYKIMKTGPYSYTIQKLKTGILFTYSIYDAIIFFVCAFKIFCLFIFREGEGRDKERERNINVWLLLACPPTGTQPSTQACALPGNQTCNPLVHRSAFNPLRHTNQGIFFLFLKKIMLANFWE